MHSQPWATAGKLATLKGTVTRMSHVRPLMADMAFTCNKCGCSMKIELPDGRFTPPTRCGGKQCHGSSHHACMHACDTVLVRTGHR